MFSDMLIERIRELKRTSIVIDGSRLDVVIANLRFLHDAVVASEQLLIDAADSTDLLPRNPFHTRLSEYYRSHVEEERGEVALLVDDLKSAGVRLGAPDPLAMAMVGTQYYLLKHVHPATLLGYMAVQEADPTPLAVVNILEQAHGKDLLRFLRLHAVKDLEHRKELIEVIDRAPEPLHALVADSAENVLGYFSQAVPTWG